MKIQPITRLAQTEKEFSRKHNTTKNTQMSTIETSVLTCALFQVGTNVPFLATQIRLKANSSGFLHTPKLRCHHFFVSHPRVGLSSTPLLKKMDGTRWSNVFRRGEGNR